MVKVLSICKKIDVNSFCYFFAMRLIRETIHFGHQLPCIPNLVHLSVSVSVGLVGYNLGNFKLPRTFCLFLLSF